MRGQGVVSGLGERLGMLRAARSISVKELAVALSVPYSDLLRLESGPRRQPPADLLRRLSDYFATTEAYILLGEEPSPNELRIGFFRHYEALGSQRRQALKFEPIQGRIEEVLRYLESAYPTVLDRRQVAARLGYTPQSLDDVLRGRAPLESHLLKRLSSQVGLSMDFFVRGDFFGGAVPDDTGLSPDKLSAYYQVVQEAIAAGISPTTLRKAVQLLSVRSDEP